MHFDTVGASPIPTFNRIAYIASEAGRSQCRPATGLLTARSCVYGARYMPFITIR